MKHYLSYLWLIVAPLVLNMGFGLPILPLFCLILLCIGLNAMRPKLGGGLFANVICLGIFFATVGVWGWNYLSIQFQRNLPVTTGTLPRTATGLDVLAAANLDPTAPEAKMLLIYFQRNKEQQLPAAVLAKLKNNDLDGALGEIKKADMDRRKIKEIINGPKPMPTQAQKSPSAPTKLTTLDWGENVFVLEDGGATPWLTAGGGDISYSSLEGRGFKVEYANGKVLDKVRANDPNLYMPYARRVIVDEAQTIVITRK